MPKYMNQQEFEHHAEKLEEAIGYVKSACPQEQTHLLKSMRTLIGGMLGEHELEWDSSNNRWVIPQDQSSHST